MLIALSLLGCKGQRTQKPGGKDRLRIHHIELDGLAADENGNLSPFSLTEGIEGNFSYEEIAGCSSESDCQYKGYGRFVLYAEPLNFNAALIEQMKNEKVKTKNLDLSVLAGPYIDDVSGKAYSKAFMDEVKKQSQGFTVGRSAKAYKDEQKFLYDKGKELAELAYNPNAKDISNLRAFTYKDGDIVGVVKFSLYTPINSAQFSRTTMQTLEKDKDYEVVWEQTKEGIIQIGYQCKDKKGTPYELFISMKDENHDGKYTISKDDLNKGLPDKCTGATKICRSAPQTITESKINGWGKTCVAGDFKRVKPKA